jgi:hypothetical protein
VSGIGIADLEIWLMGTPTDVDTALQSLRSAGRVTGVSKPQRLYGADAGRVRRYVRMTVDTRWSTGRGRGAA